MNDFNLSVSYHADDMGDRAVITLALDMRNIEDDDTVDEIAAGVARRLRVLRDLRVYDPSAPYLVL